MDAMTRRRFLQYGAGAGAALALPWGRIPTARAAGGVQLRKYVQPVPLPGAGIVVATPSGAD
ncbi:MAG: twin-arginine translocation signal domain-containing protein, partial [Gaiellaceae bacterium]